jgi:hypothetical protein
MISTAEPEMNPLITGRLSNCAKVAQAYRSAEQQHRAGDPGTRPRQRDVRG